MKMTLKAFKEAVKVGTKMRAIEHCRAEQLGKVRTVTKAQGNGFFFLVEGDERRSWLDYPKASQLEFDGKHARIRLDDQHWLTLEIL
jgi:hypothetical protein